MNKTQILSQSKYVKDLTGKQQPTNEPLSFWLVGRLVFYSKMVRLPQTNDRLINRSGQKLLFSFEVHFIG